MALVELELLTLPEHLSSPLVVSSRVRIIRFLVLRVCFVDRCLSCCTFYFGHCVVCPSINGLYIPFWYSQAFFYLCNASGYQVKYLNEIDDELILTWCPAHISIKV